MRFFIADSPDNFILLPTFVVQLGPCEGCGKVAGFSISLVWFNFEIGLEVPFIHND